MSAPVGVVLIGHGTTASGLLAAARGILPDGGLADVVAVDAGAGETPGLSGTLCDALAGVDAGRGVLLVVDLVGSSPCNCALREAGAHRLVTLSGVNLAMLLKLNSLDRTEMSAEEIARAMADSAQRAVTVQSDTKEDNE